MTLFTLLFVASGCSDNKSETEKIQKIRIITMGFMQGQTTPFEKRYSRNRVRKYGGPAAIATVVDKLVQEAESAGSKPVVIDLGDNLSGSAEALLTKGQVMARFLSEIPLSATLIGNLEFAYGEKVLEKYFKDLHIPFVASNITAKDGGPLPFTNRYVDVMAGDVKILIAGLTPPNLKYICLPSNTEGVKVMDWFDSPLKEINKEKEKRQAQILLLLSQESLGKKDEKLRKALNNNHIDLLVGLDFARKGIVRETKNGYTITFPGHNRGQRVGVTDLSYSKGRGIFAISTKFKTIDPSVETEKPSIKKWLQKSIDQHSSKLDEEIATIASPLDRQFFGEGDTGNLTADSIKEATKASIVCINSGGVATDLGAGPVKLRDFYALIPFENKVVSFDIKGKDLLKFLRETLGKGSPLQVAGIKLEMRSIEGKRGYELTNIRVDNRPVDVEKTYSFATNDFVKGRSPQLIATGEVNETSLVRDCVINFLRKHSPYSPPGKSRIVIH